MEINFRRVVRNTVEPKLNYHGFKFNEERSNTVVGDYEFTRTYWGMLQYVSISRVRYDLSEVGDLTAEGDDIPTEVSEQPGSIAQPSSNLWLSNRYITVGIGHDHTAIELTPRGLANYAEFRLLADVPFDQAKPAMRQLRRDTIWWKFASEAELRHALNEMIRIIVTDGLDWFERQVAEVRRYHEKLDARRRAESERTNRRQRKQTPRTA